MFQAASADIDAINSKISVKHVHDCDFVTGNMDANIVVQHVYRIGMDCLFCMK